MKKLRLQSTNQPIDNQLIFHRQITATAISKLIFGTLIFLLISGDVLWSQEKTRYGGDTTVYPQLRKRIVALSDSVLSVPSDTTLLFRRANLFFDTEQWKFAESDFTHCIALSPDNFGYYYMRGSARQRLSDFPGSYEDFTKVIALKPDYPHGWLDRGIILSDAGLYKEGMADYRQALVVSPGWGVVYFQIGVSFSDQGKIDSAEYYYRKAIAADTTLYKAYYNMGRMYEQIWMDTTQALFYYEKALAIWPNYTMPLVNRGLIRIARGDKPGGCADLSRAIELGRADRIRTHEYYCK